jgi:hypothetical protein
LHFPGLKAGASTVALLRSAWGSGFRNILPDAKEGKRRSLRFAALTSG